MIAFFRKSRFLDAEDEEWHVAVWAFLLDNFGGLDTLKQTRLVNATREFFPPVEATGHGRAEHIFNCVKTHAGMGEWPCMLMAQPERIRTHVADYVHLDVVKNRMPLGTFQAKDGQVTISYDPESLKDPAVLVATLSHELAHYLLAAKHNRIPGGDEMHEYATDLATVYLGFGLFGANRAFEFSQHGDSFGQGWRYSSAGYLRQRDWVFALAVFQVLRGERADTLKALLKPHLYVDLRKAERYLEKNSELLAPLRS